MSQVRLYLDEDAMRRSFVFGLRARNVDALTAADADVVNRSDEYHLTAAAAAGRALFTYNTSDYCSLHQDWMSVERNHAGIIVARQQQYSVSEELRRVMRLLSRYNAEQMQNRLEFLSS